jgi:hypothetical protein
VSLPLTRRPAFLLFYRRLASLLQLRDQLTKNLQLFTQHHLKRGKSREEAMLLNPDSKAIHALLNLKKQFRIAASSRIGPANEPTNRFL